MLMAASFPEVMRLQTHGELFHEVNQNGKIKSTIKMSKYNLYSMLEAETEIFLSAAVG
jgi:hypothetical protein